MNPDQLKYARNKLQEVYNTACYKVGTRYAISEPNPLTYEKFVAKFKAGDLKLKKQKTANPFKHAYGSPTLGSVFELFEFHNHTKYDTHRQNQEREVIRRAFTKCMDELMLGDQKKALTLIQDFTKLCEDI